MYSLDVTAASLHIANYLIILFLKKERLDPASGSRRRYNKRSPIKLKNYVLIIIKLRQIGNKRHIKIALNHLKATL